MKKQLGNVHLRIEGDDELIIVEQMAGSELADLEKLGAYLSDVAKRHLIYMIIDLGRSEVAEGTRNLTAAHFKIEWFACTVFVGANLPTRLAMKTMQLAMIPFAVLGKRSDPPMLFAQDEAEARALIAQHKAKVAKR